MVNHNQTGAVMMTNRFSIMQIAKVFCLISGVCWILLCIRLLWSKYHLLRYPKIIHWGFGLTFVFLLIPLPFILLAFIWLRSRKTKKSAWASLVACGLCIFFVFEFVSVLCVFAPEISETRSHADYLVPDRKKTIPTGVKAVFPERPGTNDSYHYYRVMSFRESESDLCIALRAQYTPNQFEQEKKRLQEISFLQAEETVWDGFQKHSWSEYDAYTASISRTGTGYVWVLIGKQNDTVIYYYRGFANQEDSFLRTFLEENSNSSK